MNKVLSVRPIYQQVSLNFDLLTSAYGFELSEPTKLDLQDLIIAVDVVDNYLDRIPSKKERIQFSDSCIAFLSDSKQKLPASPPSLVNESLSNLRDVVYKLEIAEPFSLALKDVLHHTEAKRTAKSTQGFLTHIQLEGTATGLMPLLIMGNLSTPAFRTMFSLMCQSMGIADLLLDAREDYRAGLSPVKPSFTLYFRILQFLIPKGLYIFWIFPNKFKLMKYLFKMIYHLVKSE